VSARLVFATRSPHVAFHRDTGNCVHLISEQLDPGIAEVNRTAKMSAAVIDAQARAFGEIPSAHVAVSRRLGATAIAPPLHPSVRAAVSQGPRCQPQWNWTDATLPPCRERARLDVR